MHNPLYFRIATTKNGLENGANFFVRDIPPPSDIQFRDHTQTQDVAQGGQSRHGYINAEVSWRRLKSSQATVIRDLVKTVETNDGHGNGTIYLTIPRPDAEHGGLNWIDISGIVRMPEWRATQNGYGIVYDNVTLRVSNITIESTPSSVLRLKNLIVSVSESITVTDTVTSDLPSVPASVSDSITVSESITVTIV
jgi:hypothetical protein